MTGSAMISISVLLKTNIGEGAGGRSEKLV